MKKKAQRNHVVWCLGSGRACDGVGLGRDFSVPENGFGAARSGRGDDIKQCADCDLVCALRNKPGLAQCQRNENQKPGAKINPKNQKRG